MGYKHFPPSEAERTVTYRAGETFTSVGWKKVARVDEDVVVFSPDGEVVGNRLTSTIQGAYVFPFSRRMQRAGLTRRWHLTYFSEPMHGYSGVTVSFREAGLRFVLNAVVPDRGEPFIQLMEHYRPSIKGMQAPLPLDGVRLLKFEMTFDPARKSATVAVDGRVLLEGYRGTSEYLDLPGVAVGFGSYLSKTGEGVFGDQGCPGHEF